MTQHRTLAPRARDAAPRTTTCHSCGDRIIWCLTDKGRRMPVDVDPTPDGSLLLSTGRVPIATTVSRGGRGDQLLHKAHFATCGRPPQRRTTSPAPARTTAPSEQGALFGAGR